MENNKLSLFSNCNQILLLDFKHVLHLYSLGIKRLNNYDGITPTLGASVHFLNCIEYSVNEDFKPFWTSADSNSTIVQNQNRLDLKGMRFLLLKLRTNSTQIVHSIHFTELSQVNQSLHRHIKVKSHLSLHLLFHLTDETINTVWCKTVGFLYDAQYL